MQSNIITSLYPPISMGHLSHVLSFWFALDNSIGFSFFLLTTLFHTWNAFSEHWKYNTITENLAWIVFRICGNVPSLPSPGLGGSRSSRPATSLLWAATLTSGEIHSHSFLNLIICSRQICKCLLCTHLHHELHFTMTWRADINHLKMIIVTNRSLRKIKILHAVLWRPWHWGWRNVERHNL